MTGKENGTIITAVHARAHTHLGSMGSQKGYSCQLGDKLLNYQNRWIKNLQFYGFKKGEGHPEQISVRTLPHGVNTLEISDTL